MRKKLNNEKYFNPLNDYFICYIFTDKGSSESILLDFINSIMLNANMKTFRSVEILTPSPKAGCACFFVAIPQVLPSVAKEVGVLRKHTAWWAKPCKYFKLKQLF